MRTPGPIHAPDLDTARRFWTRVQRTSERGCWLWKPQHRHGPRGDACYPTFYDPRTRRTIQARRFAYALIHGNPKGVTLYNQCGNHRCVNPDHLGTTRPGGEIHCRAKINRRQALEIRRSYRPGVNHSDRGNARELAARYGITRDQVRNIATGRRWAHLGEGV